MLCMTKQRGNLVNAQPYALPDFMHYLLCIIEMSTVVIATNIADGGSRLTIKR